MYGTHVAGSDFPQFPLAMAVMLVVAAGVLFTGFSAFSEDHMQTLFLVPDLGIRKALGTWKWRAMRRINRKAQGEAILLAKYRKFHGRALDMQHPTAFTAKLFRRMVLLNRKNDPLFTQLADKHAVRSWVNHRIGEEHLVPLLWTGTDPTEIPFDALPSRFVIKSNHASGQVIVVNGDCDRAAIVRKCQEWLKVNLYWVAREAQYRPIKPRIMIEQFLATRDGQPTLDYRFWCFRGNPAMIQVDDHEHSINPFFSTAWKPLDVSYRPNAKACEIPRPANLDTMIGIASNLSQDLDFVRVDLYNIDGRIFFGEMTFTPVGGGFNFSPPEWDERLGALWR
jgi:hypothetical protein